MKDFDTDRWNFRYYDSVNATVEASCRPVPWGASSRSSGRAGWFGTDSHEAAAELAINGWSDARPDVDAILMPVRERLSEILEWTAQIDLDMTGYEPDIDLYLAGELECMREYVPVEAPAKGKVFNLLVNGGFLANVDASEVFARGAAIVALVEAFQILGHDLNIYVESSVHDRQDEAIFTALTKVHSAGENLDVNNLMMPLGHPSWLRRIIFGVREAEPSYITSRFEFHGRTAELQCVEMVDASIVLSVAHGRRASYDPVGWVLAQLEIQGVWTPDKDKFHG